MGREAIPHGEIVVDDRGRTCLARIRREQHGRYKAAERQDGTIVLTPVITVHPADLADLEAARVTAEQLLARRARVRYHAELAGR